MAADSTGSTGSSTTSVSTASVASRMRATSRREEAGSVTPSVDNELVRARRGLAWRRWTPVITTSATGVVLVSSNHIGVRWLIISPRLAISSRFFKVEVSHLIVTKLVAAFAAS